MKAAGLQEDLPSLTETDKTRIRELFLYVAFVLCFSIKVLVASEDMSFESVERCVWV